MSSRKGKYSSRCDKAGKVDDGGNFIQMHVAISSRSPFSTQKRLDSSSPERAKFIKADDKTAIIGEEVVKGRSAVRVANPWTREFDFTEGFYTPHTMLCMLFIVLVILFLLRYYWSSSMGVVSEVKLGLSAVVFVFVGFGTVNLQDSFLVRPHPAVWRAVLACGIMYFAFLTFVIFLDLDTVRVLFSHYDPQLLHPGPERAYAEDCRISTKENPFLFLRTVFDIFVVAHALGYVFKAFVLRDWRMVTCVSLGFEVVEVSLQHVLPNFRECWWDHLLLDVLLCNTGGTILGMWLLGKFQAKRYHWIALKEIKCITDKTKRLLGQIGPRNLEVYHWNIMESPKRFFCVCGVLMLIYIQELNCFTLKTILNMPPQHPLVVGRLVLWTLLAIPGMREFYEYTSNPSQKRIGSTAWVSIFGLVLETIWIAKMATEGHYFMESMPAYVAVPWMVAIVFFTLWIVLYFTVLPAEWRRKGQQRELKGCAFLLYCLVHVFLYTAGGAIAWLFLMGMPDLQIGRRTFTEWFGPFEKSILFWR